MGRSCKILWEIIINFTQNSHQTNSYLQDIILKCEVRESCPTNCQRCSSSSCLNIYPRYNPQKRQQFISQSCSPEARKHRVHIRENTHHIAFPLFTTSSPACASISWLASKCNRCLGLSGVSRPELSPDIVAPMSNRSELKQKAKCDKVKIDRKDVSESWKAGK